MQCMWIEIFLQWKMLLWFKSMLIVIQITIATSSVIVSPFNQTIEMISDSTTIGHTLDVAKLRKIKQINLTFDLKSFRARRTYSNTDYFILYLWLDQILRKSKVDFRSVVLTEIPPQLRPLGEKFRSGFTAVSNVNSSHSYSDE